ncbi:putative HTH-type transcriptional regulator YybR [Nymphon striatum]|nr:putative HTH-type transcriptional regulator YybR [Nymphon striatum]
MIATCIAAAAKNIDRPNTSSMKNSGHGVATSTRYAARASNAAMALQAIAATQTAGLGRFQTSHAIATAERPTAASPTSGISHASGGSPAPPSPALPIKANVMARPDDIKMSASVSQYTFVPRFVRPFDRPFVRVEGPSAFPTSFAPSVTCISQCPIASSLDIVGDKWTLLVLRDLLDGKTRFSEFERSPESIPTNILTERLRRLEQHGLAERVQGAGRRVDYLITPKGESFRAVILALAEWGNANIADTWVPPADYLTSPVRASDQPG